MSLTGTSHCLNVLYYYGSDLSRQFFRRFDDEIKEMHYVWMEILETLEMLEGRLMHHSTMVSELPLSGVERYKDEVVCPEWRSFCTIILCSLRILIRNPLLQCV